eukprot:3930085-Rhodomonas_salina.2
MLSLPIFCSNRDGRHTLHLARGISHTSLFRPPLCLLSSAPQSLPLALPLLASLATFSMPVSHIIIIIIIFRHPRIDSASISGTSSQATFCSRPTALSSWLTLA